jgi:DNA-binding CsgD family transcriptional regulator
MAQNVVLDAKEMWQKMARNAPEELLGFQLEIQKRLLEFFHVGDYYCFVFNAKKADFDFVSPEVEQVLGYSAAEIDVAQIVSNIHPEDQSWFLNFENEVTKFFGRLPAEKVPHYKVRYDFRIRKRTGEYIRLLNQVVIIEHSDSFGVLRAFGVHTDITHLKAEGTPTLSFIGLNGEPSYLNVNAQEVYSTNQVVLTKREKEILHLLSVGLNTKQISHHLFLSEETVKTHRRNILRKTSKKNVAALLSSAVKNGWM